MGKTKSKKAAKTGDGEASGKLPQPRGANELHEPFWSIISFEGRVASNLTYDEAVEKTSSMAEAETPGLCIVTNAAAQRIEGN